jgi:hypothetical protein
VRLAAAAAALALCAACGYGVVGFGGKLPGGVNRVSVPLFENRTTRTDIGRKLTEDFIDKLVSSGKITVTHGEDAQAVIRGVVTAYNKEPITFDADRKPLANRLTVVMDVSLVSSEGGRILFEERGVAARWDYVLTSVLELNDRQEDDSVGNVSKLMSEKLVNLMLEGF